MANVVVTMKIMPEDPSTDLKKIENEASEKIKNFGGNVGKVEVIPIAFGLQSVNIIFIMDENKGSTDELENQISSLEGVNSAEVSDVRRTIG